MGDLGETPAFQVVGQVVHHQASKHHIECGAGETLGPGEGFVARLVELELAIESGHATPALLAERDALLERMARAEV